MKKDQENWEKVDWMHLDDRILIKAFVKGDVAAFEVLFKKYRDQVSRMVYSMIRDAGLVDDVVQEVFLLVYRHLKKFRHQSSFKTWLYRITVNETMRQIGKTKRWQNMVTESQDQQYDTSSMIILNEGTSPERIVIDGEQKSMVRKAMENLKPNQKLILNLYYMEDLSIHEIAEILQVPSGSVKSRLFYARDALKKLLEPVLGKEKVLELNERFGHGL